MLDFICNLMYYGAINNIINAAIFTAIEYFSEPENFFDNMTGVFINCGMYGLEKYNMIHKKYFAEQKNLVINNEEMYLLDKESKTIHVLNDRSEIINDKRYTTFVSVNGRIIEVTDVATIDDMTFLDVFIKPQFLSMELKQGERTFDIKEILNDYIYDGVGITPSLLMFMLIKHYDYRLDDTQEYFIEILDDDVEKHTINMLEKYLVIDNDRDHGFFTLSR